MLTQHTSVTRLLLRDLCVGAGLILMWLLLSELLGLDERLTNYYFDQASRSFLLAQQHHFFFTEVLHDGVKQLEVLLLLILPVRVVYLICKRRYAQLSVPLYLLSAMALALLLVDGVRAMSPVACPRDLLQYGGDLPLVAPWAFAQGLHGHCWPSGHAGGGFCLLALFFWLRASASRWAWPVLGGILLLGSLMSWTQVVRGAHFLSHCSWSLLFCWLVTGALATVWWRQSVRTER